MSDTSEVPFVFASKEELESVRICVIHQLDQDHDALEPNWLEYVFERPDMREHLRAVLDRMDAPRAMTEGGSNRAVVE